MQRVLIRRVLVCLSWYSPPRPRHPALESHWSTPKLEVSAQVLGWNAFADRGSWQGSQRVRDWILLRHSPSWAECSARKSASYYTIPFKLDSPPLLRHRDKKVPSSTSEETYCLVATVTHVQLTNPIVSRWSATRSPRFRVSSVVKFSGCHGGQTHKDSPGRPIFNESPCSHSCFQYYDPHHSGQRGHTIRRRSH